MRIFIKGSFSIRLVLEYKTELIEKLSISNVTEMIDEKIKSMALQGYEFITLSFIGTQRTVLVFRKLKQKNILIH